MGTLEKNQQLQSLLTGVELLYLVPPREKSKQQNPGLAVCNRHAVLAHLHLHTNTPKQPEVAAIFWSIMMA